MQNDKNGNQQKTENNARYFNYLLFTHLSY